MTVNASGAVGAVHPISMGGGGRRLPPWVWLVVLVVIALHVGALLVLARLGVIRMPPTSDTGPPPITVIPYYRPTPPPPPTPQRATPPRTVTLRPTQGPIDKATETVPIPPQPGHPDANQGATTLAHEPPQPPVETKPEPTRGPPVIGQPRWISQPSPEQMSAAYPQAAVDGNVEGRALLRCSVTAQGTVTACAVVSETPRGYGFGQAAQRLSRYFRMTPRTEDGRPVEGAKVDIPLQFRL